MTDRHDDAARDLVHRAHQTDPEHGGFDAAAGLADVLSRASEPAAVPARDTAHEAQEQGLLAAGGAALQEPEWQVRQGGGTSSLIVATSRDLLDNALPHEWDSGRFRTSLFGEPDPIGGFGMPMLPGGDISASQGEQPLVESGSLVRPYARTGGRTRTDYDLPIEALVSTTDKGRDAMAKLLPEHRAICDLCMDTRSVAEVAAHLRLPLGVARVLIGDMVGRGLVLIHSSSAVGDRPSIEFMERVLKGLRRL